MKKIILATLLTISASSAMAVTQIYTCGDVAISDNCDVDVCKVSLQIADKGETPFYVTIGQLDGVSLRTEQGVLQLGLNKIEGKMLCVAGEIFGNSFIPVAKTAE